MQLAEADSWMPSRIIQIVSASRSGSSLLKHLLAQSPDIVSLAGEEEPYIKMSGNGFGITSNYEGFSELLNPNYFRQLILTELLASNPWEWRLRLQFRGPRLSHLLDKLPMMDVDNPIPWLVANEIYGYYDGAQVKINFQDQDFVWEMPPYVMPKPTNINSGATTLLLKSPYNCYRPNILQQAYPGVPVQYLVLLRNPAATINGLISGWEAPYGFHKHLTKIGWWKFDIPVGWEWLSRSSHHRAFQQWKQSSDNIVIDYLPAATCLCRFEDLINKPSAVLRNIYHRCEIKPAVLSGDCPTLMATETPQPFRWRERAAQIDPLLARAERLISELGYGDRTQWY